MLKDFVEFVAKSIVDDPESVWVDETEGERSAVFALKVSSGDMGKIIGRKGRVIRAFRSLVYAAGIKEGKRATLEIVEE